MDDLIIQFARNPDGTVNQAGPFFVDGYSNASRIGGSSSGGAEGGGESGGGTTPPPENPPAPNP